MIKDGGHSVVHLSDKFPRDEPDVKWIAHLASERQGTVIISGDDRIMHNPHEREVWRQAALTTFFLAPGWAHQKFWDKTWMFVRWFPVLIDQAKLVAPGAGFIVPVSHGRNKLKSI